MEQASTITLQEWIILIGLIGGLCLVFFAIMWVFSTYPVNPDDDDRELYTHPILFERDRND